MQNTIKVLAIETSCDETAAAVYCSDSGILSNIIFSQTEAHKLFGGVVPEIASRAQLEKINHVVNNALLSAHTTLENINVIAVTNNPGLPGALLVGVCFAKGISYAKNIRIIGVNHLEGHAFSPMLEHEIPFPFLCLTASGGHTQLYLIHDYGKFETIGSTSDDAAGEAFDKVAKMLRYPYPGGPIIEQLAKQVDFQDFFKYPRLKNKDLSFSFSGLKTAVLYHLVKQGAYDLKEKKFLATDNIQLKQAVASSLLVCVTDIFEDRIIRTLSMYPQVKALAFAGGVACNQYIKSRLSNLARIHAIPFYFPSQSYCTDNAAMIAFVGCYKARQNQFSDWSLDIY